ncbi:MAG: DUF937 domain-containing protein [Verrucomicrobiota bacterium]
MSFLNQLLEAHGGSVTDALTSKLGLSAEEAGGVLPKIVPLILGGLARQAQKNGPEGVASLLEEHGTLSDDDIPNHLAEQAESGDPMSAISALIGGNTGGGALGGMLSGKGALGGLLGGNLGNMASNALGEYLGVEGEKAGKILPMLLPLVMSGLNQKRLEAGGGEAGLQSVLSILDEDGDGSALDDLAEKFLGGAGGGALGGLFGGGK